MISSIRMNFGSGKFCERLPIQLNSSLGTGVDLPRISRTCVRHFGTMFTWSMTVLLLVLG